MAGLIFQPQFLFRPEDFRDLQVEFAEAPADSLELWIRAERFESEGIEKE